MPPKITVPGPVPKEALAFFRAKGLRVGFDYTDIWHEEHTLSFTAAKIVEKDVLKDLKRIVQRSIEQGLPFSDFKKDAGLLLSKSGWANYHKTTPTKARLRTIFDTNMRMARATGQWQRVERTKRTRPYLVYELGPSTNHRPEHEGWAGTILPVDDPFWDAHYPPSAYG